MKECAMPFSRSAGVNYFEKLVFDNFEFELSGTEQNYLGNQAKHEIHC